MAFAFSSVPLREELEPLVAQHGTLVSQLLEPNPVEQAWLLQMVHRRQAGWSYGRIAREFNRLKVPTKTGSSNDIIHEGQMCFTFRRLLTFANERLHKTPSSLVLDEIDAPLISAFLNHLEAVRKISARSRNFRLTAIRSFFRYIAYEEPSYGQQIQRVLSIPEQRCTKTQVQFLNRSEVNALLAAPGFFRCRHLERFQANLFWIVSC